MLKGDVLLAIGSRRRRRSGRTLTGIPVPALPALDDVAVIFAAGARGT
jgi:hypothetical protein